MHLASSVALFIVAEIHQFDTDEKSLASTRPHTPCKVQKLIASWVPLLLSVFFFFFFMGNHKTGHGEYQASMQQLEVSLWLTSGPGRQSHQFSGDPHPKKTNKLNWVSMKQTSSILRGPNETSAPFWFRGFESTSKHGQH